MAAGRLCECCIIEKRFKLFYSLLFWVQFCDNIFQFKIKRHRSTHVFLCLSQCYLCAVTRCQWFDGAKWAESPCSPTASNLSPIEVSLSRKVYTTKEGWSLHKESENLNNFLYNQATVWSLLQSLGCCPSERFPCHAKKAKYNKKSYSKIVEKPDNGGWLFLNAWARQ